MGVTGLWTVLQPCARPIKIETLNKKRLAVDASIWIYQFLKAVRDKEGNALRNSHIVGFFRRVCKLARAGAKMPSARLGSCWPYRCRELPKTRTRSGRRL
jgi:DNA excision repair protein ERCC-5